MPRNLWPRPATSTQYIYSLHLLTTSTHYSYRYLSFSQVRQPRKCNELDAMTEWPACAELVSEAMFIFICIVAYSGVAFVLRTTNLPLATYPHVHRSAFSTRCISAESQLFSCTRVTARRSERLARLRAERRNCSGMPSISPKFFGLNKKYCIRLRTVPRREYLVNIDKGRRTA